MAIDPGARATFQLYRNQCAMDRLLTSGRESPTSILMGRLLARSIPTSAAQAQTVAYTTPVLAAGNHTPDDRIHGSGGCEFGRRLDLGRCLRFRGSAFNHDHDGNHYDDDRNHRGLVRPSSNDPVNHYHFDGKLLWNDRN